MPSVSASPPKEAGKNIIHGHPFGLRQSGGNAEEQIEAGLNLPDPLMRGPAAEHAGQLPQVVADRGRAEVVGARQQAVGDLAAAVHLACGNSGECLTGAEADLRPSAPHGDLRDLPAERIRGLGGVPRSYRHQPVVTATGSASDVEPRAGSTGTSPSARARHSAPRSIARRHSRSSPPRASPCASRSAASPRTIMGTSARDWACRACSTVPTTSPRYSATSARRTHA